MNLDPQDCLDLLIILAGGGRVGLRGVFEQDFVRDVLEGEESQGFRVEGEVKKMRRVKGQVGHLPDRRTHA